MHPRDFDHVFLLERPTASTTAFDAMFRLGERAFVWTDQGHASPDLCGFDITVLVERQHTAWEAALRKDHMAFSDRLMFDPTVECRLITAEASIPLPYSSARVGGPLVKGFFGTITTRFPTPDPTASPVIHLSVEILDFSARFEVDIVALQAAIDRAGG